MTEWGTIVVMKYDYYTEMFCYFYYHICHALCNYLIISK